MAERTSKGKTETIKERAIYVYLPSHEMVKQWKERADKSGVSISKFVIEHVENSLRQEADNEYQPRAELIKKLRESEEENKKIREDNRILKLAFEKLEKELQEYRAKPFLTEEFKGLRSYEKELIELLKQKKFIDSDHLLDLLKIDPRKTDVIKAIYKQLESLQAYDLVEATPRGWRWKE